MGWGRGLLSLELSPSEKKSLRVLWNTRLHPDALFPQCYIHWAIVLNDKK